jgi:hypothetical protein
MNNTDTRCLICNWSNTGLLNIGNPNEPQVWICHGCVKRVYEERNQLRAALKGCVEAMCFDINSKSDDLDVIIKGIVYYKSLLANEIRRAEPKHLG